MNTYFIWSIGLLVIFFQATEARWRQTSGPWGGLINCFAMGGNAILAGSMGDGVFRSTDNGSNWDPVNSGLRSIKIIRTLSVAGGILLAGTLESPIGESGVLASADNGLHWNDIASIFTNDSLNWSPGFRTIQ